MPAVFHLKLSSGWRTR